MQQPTNNSVYFDKIKSILVLGLTSNFTTFAGTLMIWIISSRNHIVSGVFDSFLFLASFAPIFLGDAIGSFVLARIRLDTLKKWNDIKITDLGRQKLETNNIFFRSLSMVPAYLLALLMLSSFRYNDIWQRVLLHSFCVLFFLHFIKSVFILRHFVAPIVKGYSDSYILKRFAILVVVFVIWLYFLNIYSKTQMDITQIFTFGFIYFLMNAYMQPLPTSYSVMTGKKTQRTFSSKMVLLGKEQFSNILGYNKLLELVDSIIESKDFYFLGNIKMPLFQLPVLDSYGAAFISNDKKTILFILISTLSSKIHRTLLSQDLKRYYISSDCDYKDFIFPETVQYNKTDPGLSEQEFFAKHRETCPEEIKIIDSEPFKFVNLILKEIICHLAKKVQNNE